MQYHSSPPPYHAHAHHNEYRCRHNYCGQKYCDHRPGYCLIRLDQPSRQTALGRLAGWLQGFSGWQRGSPDFAVPPPILFSTPEPPVQMQMADHHASPHQTRLHQPAQHAVFASCRVRCCPDCRHHASCSTDQPECQKHQTASQAPHGQRQFRCRQVGHHGRQRCLAWLARQSRSLFYSESGWDDHLPLPR